MQVVSTTGKERFSTAFFMDADFDCIVDTADIPACQVRTSEKSRTQSHRSANLPHFRGLALHPFQCMPELVSLPDDPFSEFAMVCHKRATASGLHHRQL